MYMYANLLKYQLRPNIKNTKYNTSTIILFIDSFVFFCDFHREQSWTRWVSKTDNGVGDSKEKVLAMMRRCAHSCSVEEFEVALESLTNSKEWISNARLRNWFTKTWLSEKKV